ncbi:YraN family protein [Caedibacter taeniospiralis]|uniref:YraN family protein n=1 Tax=Caedibacter taeniospiralis TaxID=28907 RepID=UPI000C26E7D0|nr:YraN family protein [Caedibacter taeniospiralis]
MSRQIGQNAEEQACQFLQQNGFSLICQNFSTPLGEIDLIGVLDGIVLFVEVKARRSAEFGTALDMVSKTKQIKIRKTAEIFLQRYTRYQNAECRFDVIGITGGEIQWVKAAF